jgi:hypothetical protein
MVVVDSAIPVREDEDTIGAADTATDVPDHVRRRLVGPVGVLDDQDGRLSPR